MSSFTSHFQYGYKPAGGVEHVPPGWDHWNGLVSGASLFWHISLAFIILSGPS